MILFRYLFIHFLISEAFATGENKACRTPSQENGVCIRFTDCSKLFSLLQNQPISVKDKSLVRQSQCAFTGGTRFVCCPESSSDNLEIYDPCLTPNNLEGTCQPFRTCSVLFNMYQASPLTTRNQKLIRESKCATVNGATYVCCPSNAATTPKPATTTTIPRTTTDFPGNKPCKNPLQESGTCIKLKDCHKVFKMLEKKPISPRNRQFLKSSQCGFKEVPYVCCAHNEVNGGNFEETTTKKPLEVPRNSEPQWLKALKEKVPQSPHCGFDSIDRIFGGKETEIDEFPWLVLVEYKKPNNRTGFHCGGSLINERYVLTAAHCVKKIPTTWELTSVRVREWNTETDSDCSRNNLTFCLPPSENILVTEKIHFKDYRPQSKSQHSDIALLRLAKKVKFDELLQPICLPLDQNLWNKDYTDHSFEVAGWGRTREAIRSQTKLKVTLPFIPRRTCQKVYVKQGKEMSDTQMCAGGEKGKDSCNGDSGGPLMSYNVANQMPYWYIVGVVSYGPADCGTENIPGVYTQVASFLEWISKHIR